MNNRRVYPKSTDSSVYKDSLIQYIAFPFPFNTSKDNFYSTIGIGTFRTTIIDNE
jgi:hypothetical protein